MLEYSNLGKRSPNSSAKWSSRLAVASMEDPGKCAVPAGSVLYVWGYNDSGQTAHDRQMVREPSRVAVRPGNPSLRVVDIACGLLHTAAVTSDGSLFTWGSNECGQLGDGSEEESIQPKRVDSLQNETVKSVACGASCTAAITDSKLDNSQGRLWVWGQNQGSNFPRLFWGAFSPNTVISQVSCGRAHVAALSADGVLQAWGYNECGQLGRGFSCEGRQGARIISAFVKFLDETPDKIRIKEVACGEYHTAAIAENGDVYTWGLGSMGQLGHRTLQSPHKEVLPRRVVALEGVSIKQISAGGVHTCAIASNGALYMWGGGQAGQLGLGPQNDFLRSNADIFLQRIPVPVIPSGARYVTCGHSHSLVAMEDGRLLGWGYNNYGQANTGKATYAWYPSPIDWCVGEVKRLAAGGGHSAVLTQAFSLKELCELKLADCVTPSSSLMIADIASRTGADSLARFCVKLRERLVLQRGGSY